MSETSARPIAQPVSVPTYPCDRGDPGAVLGRGWHNFQVGPTGRVCCTLCGAVPPERTPSYMDTTVRTAMSR